MASHRNLGMPMNGAAESQPNVGTFDSNSLQYMNKLETENSSLRVAIGTLQREMLALKEGLTALKTRPDVNCNRNDTLVQEIQDLRARNDELESRLKEQYLTLPLAQVGGASGTGVESQGTVTPFPDSGA